MLQLASKACDEVMLNVRDIVAQMVRKAFIISTFNLTWTNTSQT